MYSTLNVQHIESLNDVVGGITNIRVTETVPDTVFDEADDVVLVDLTPDELLRRLKEGKVYLPQQAERHPPCIPGPVTPWRPPARPVPSSRPA